LRVLAETCGLVRDALVGINSEVSYQLDHAPAGDRGQGFSRANIKQSSRKKAQRSIPTKIARALLTAQRREERNYEKMQGFLFSPSMRRPKNSWDLLISKKWDFCTRIIKKINKASRRSVVAIRKEL
jgi:hypothetical protein